MKHHLKKSDHKLYYGDLLKFGIILIIGFILNFVAYRIPASCLMITPLFAIEPDSTERIIKMDEKDNIGKKADRSLPPETIQREYKLKQIFHFDPNLVSEPSLRKLGFTSFVSKNWVAYQKAGGRFQTLDDILKIYGVDTALVKQLIPYIKLPNSLVKSIPNKFNSIEVNQASIEDWQKLKGIGPVLSKRIVKFRNALGGFHSIAQVSETFGLPDSTFRIIEPHLNLASSFGKIAINSISEEALKRHPYISWKQAKILVRYRKEKQFIMDIDDLQNSEIFESTELQILEPYLNFNIQDAITPDTLFISEGSDISPDSEG